MAHEVFISYSSKDQAAAEAVHGYLMDAGIPCWLAPSDLVPGSEWDAEIVKAINASRVFVLILSTHADSSVHVRNEVHHAVSMGLHVIPFRIDGITGLQLSNKMRYYLAPLHWLDASAPPLDRHLPRLSRAVSDYLAPRDTAPETRFVPQIRPLWTPSDLSLVGRSREMGRLRQVWQEAKAGQAQAILVSAQAGTGKTRLVQEFLSGLIGEEVFVLASTPMSTQQAPYATIADALDPVMQRDVMPSLPEEVLGEIEQLRKRVFTCLPSDEDRRQAQERRQRAVLTFVKTLCQKAPVVLFFDDLQWTDEASARFAEYLLVHSRRDPLLVIASSRTDEAAELSKSVSRFRTTLNRCGLLTEIRLQPLDAQDTHRLVCAWTGLPALPLFSQRLYRFTEGNPYFLLEVLRALEEEGVIQRSSAEGPAPPHIDYEQLEVPQTIREAVSLRLDALDEPTQDFLKVAAVVGHTFNPLLVQQAAELDDHQTEQALDQLVRRQLVLPRKGILCDFANTLTQQTVYAELNPVSRRRLHRQVSVALEQALGPTPSLAEIQSLALHMTHAERWQEAFDYSLRAGLMAWELAEADTARMHLQRADRLASEQALPVTDEQRIACQETLGDALASLGQHEEARIRYHKAHELVHDDPQKTATLLMKRGVTFQEQGKLEEAAESLDRALEALEAAPDDGILSRICIQQGIMRVRRRELDEGLSWAERAMVVESAQAHNLLAAVHHGLGNLHQAEQHCHRAIALAQEAGNPFDLAKAYTNLGVALSAQDRWQEARQAHERALETQFVTTDLRMYAATHCNLSDVHRHLGNPKEAVRLAEIGLQLACGLNLEFEEALACQNLGLAWLEMQEPAKARTKYLEHALRIIDERGFVGLRAETEEAIATALRAEGEPAGSQCQR